MCVIAILGILIAVVTPSIATAARRSKAAECSANLRSIQAAKAAYLMSHVGELRIPPAPSQQYEEFEDYFTPLGLPVGCPSTDDPQLPGNRYQDLTELYKDTVCPHNCPPNRPLANYPYEPDIGGPDYYKNGYHDLYGLEK